MCCVPNNSRLDDVRYHCCCVVDSVFLALSCQGDPNSPHQHIICILSPPPLPEILFHQRQQHRQRSRPDHDRCHNNDSTTQCLGRARIRARVHFQPPIPPH